MIIINHGTLMYIFHFDLKGLGIVDELLDLGVLGCFPDEQVGLPAQHDVHQLAPVFCLNRDVGGGSGVFTLLQHQCTVCLEP